MSFEIQGEYNTATIHTDQEKEDAESIVVDQIQEMVDHEAFVGDNDIEIQPDYHYGAGAVIGFTMPLKDRIVPNTVGLDVGCGLFAAQYDLNINQEESVLEELDSEIRDRVPTGFQLHDRGEYHIVNDTPWAAIKQKYRSFDENTDFDLGDPDDVYHDDYITELCQRGSYSTTKAINSLGTLGGGNHFIELGTDMDDNLWVIIHSGSRGLGASVADYWQQKASAKMSMRTSVDDLDDSVTEYMTDEWKPKKELIRDEFDGEAIQSKFDEISQAIQTHGPNFKSNRNTDLDYLEGEEAHGYIRDMVFLQTYASESRKNMMSAVEDALDAVVYDADLHSTPKRHREIESVHNYIDFDDGVIRKGACRAHEDESLVIPINMSYGTIVATGVGNNEWNNSAPHGAGRVMSRTKAKQQFDQDTFAEETSGVFMSETPLDEIPLSYKSPDDIKDVIEETATIEQRIEPFMSIKGE